MSALAKKEPPKKAAKKAMPAKKAAAKAAKTAPARTVPIETTDDGYELDPVERVERVERVDVRHLFAIVRKWRIVVLAGVAFIVVAVLALLRLTPADYVAGVDLEFDQPIVLHSGDGNQATVRIATLLPTWAQKATSDRVLERVRQTAGVNADIRTLRSRIEGKPQTGTLILRIEARDATASVAERLATATASALQTEISEEEIRARVPPDLRYLITPLQKAEATRPTRNEVRTVILVGLLGLIVMIGVAFLLEYVERS